jgi:hypothetical protein
MKFVLVTFNMITGKFENKAGNHMLLIIDVKAAIFVNIAFKQHARLKHG